MDLQASRINGHDAPIQLVKDDLLNGLGIAKAIHRVLSTTPPEWSTRVGLYGPWGSGKTSVLNLLRALEESDGALVISFSAWSATEENGVVAQFYSILNDKLQEESAGLPRKQWIKAAVKRGMRFRFLGQLAKASVEEFAPIPPSLTKAATRALSALATSASAWAKIGREDLKAIVALLKGRRVVVFIDDLDRADPKILPKTLLAMRELLDWPGFSFVLAFDKRVISTALSEYSTAFGDDAQGFLEKVIDVPFDIPDTTLYQRRRLTESAFRACCDTMPLEAITAILPVLPSEPRRVKLIARMMGALRPSLNRHRAQDVDWTGLGFYLVVKEASQAAADWVVKAATAETVNWMLLAGDKDERENKQQEMKEVLLDLLSTPKRPPDTERIVDAALRLLRHWLVVSSDVVLYWVGLAYREPSITLLELQKLRADFAQHKDASTIDAVIDKLAYGAVTPLQDIVNDLLEVALANYGLVLNAMADAHTTVEWETRYAEAQESLLLLEHLWLQQANETLAVAATQGPTTAKLLNLFGRWLTWTRNEGEPVLRRREQDLVLAATARCVNPELLFAETDPFRNSNMADSQERAEIMAAWINKIRDMLAPRVVSRLCEKFALVDGLAPVANGDDKLSTWLVESRDSPLYTKAELRKQFIEALQGERDASKPARATLSKNARLYLEQLLFRTRNGSWGGVEHAKLIHAMDPEIVPTAWTAVVSVPVPYRMRSSLRELRENLLGIGVTSDLLPEPSWLAEEGQDERKVSGAGASAAALHIPASTP